MIESLSGVLYFNDIEPTLSSDMLVLYAQPAWPFPSQRVYGPSLPRYALSTVPSPLSLQFPLS